jgi:hypothetical protein
MRSAPPVSVRCSGGAAWRGLQTLLFTAAAAALCAWWLQSRHWPLAWVALPASKVAVLAWVATRPRPRTIAWNGQDWQCDGLRGRLEVVLDLGGFLLLRWRGLGSGSRGSHGPTRWLPVTAAEAGPAWQGLRVAAYGRQPAVQADRGPAPTDAAA